EMARLYERIELLRLGDRLQVDWQTDDLPDRALIPGLSIQPLLENAIYHGIEPLPGGGTVKIRGRVVGKEIFIEIENPITSNSAARRHDGNQMALENVRQRLELAFGDRASLEIESGEKHFVATLRLPAAEKSL
ncbi:MAG: sensor histidine kinase, partial [Gammaproteobacteria bacterium]|nr:sensor histidine kinase [Gammaproteobacteria bacterium]